MLWKMIGNIKGSEGERGPEGPQGPQGLKGDKGDPGKSAYQLAVDEGYVGSLEEWLEHTNVESWTPDGLRSLKSKVFNAIVSSNDGKWSVDFSHVGFTEVFGIQVSAFTDGGGMSNTHGNYAAVAELTNTSAKGSVNSSTSAGLLAAMVMTKASNGTMVSIRVEGI